MAGVDLTVLEGIDPNTALVLLGEIGLDVCRFPTVKYFASRLGCVRSIGARQERSVVDVCGGE
jgi:hypothetical protein